jgi:hypothetical protein
MLHFSYHSQTEVRRMKTEYDYGYEYARWLVQENQEGAGEPVDVDAMIGSTVDIPEGDYAEMKRAGIANPDPREYWRGYNAYCAASAAGQMPR